MPLHCLRKVETSSSFCVIVEDSRKIYQGEKQGEKFHVDMAG